MSMDLAAGFSDSANPASAAGLACISTNPRITVVLPVRDYHPPYLHECLRSLATQTCAAWRCIVVAEPVVREQVRRELADTLADPRLTLAVNAGRPFAGGINTGMRQAETDFVALLFADDLWSADAVEVLSAAIAAHPDVDFFHTTRRIIDEHGAAISSVYPSRPSFTLDDFTRASPVKHLLCWRRTLGIAVGGIDEALNSVAPDDWDFPWVMAEHGARFKAVPQCLYYYRDHRTYFRLTTHLPLRLHLRACNRILRKHKTPWRTRRAFLRRARRTYMRQCLYRNAVDRWLKERFGYDPRHGWRETYR